jgi:hypothetical protein
LAYSLGDPYGTLRTILRVDGVLIGWVLGAVLLFAPRAWLANWGVWLEATTWPVRMAGALLLALGIFLVWMAQERAIPPAVLASAAVANGLMALVLTFAYLRQEFAALVIAGRVGLVFVILICLLAALAPLPHLRTETRLR